VEQHFTDRKNLRRVWQPADAGISGAAHDGLISAHNEKRSPAIRRGFLCRLADARGRRQIAARAADRKPIACALRKERNMAAYEHIIVERKGAVGIIQINRPKILNALSFGVFGEIAAAVDELESDPKIGCIVVTGNEKAFAAGADIKEMQPKKFMDMYSQDFMDIGGDRVATCKKPTIAAVSGYALGGGCELAMMCDIIIASDTAKFGQPEITLGTIPGLGGTQRLTRAVGKSKAMDLCLTGRMMDAAEAERSGLVSRIFPADKLIDEVMAIAEKIASMSQPVAAMAKNAVNRVFETTLAQGMDLEGDLFHATFGLEDKAEGMAAFLEKRKPDFKNR
jgi:enoyl-CoA hydratase